MATAVSYIIYLTDAERVQALQTQYPNGIQIPPTLAASTYGVPGPQFGTNNLNLTGGIGVLRDDSVGFGADLTSSFNSQTFTVTYTSPTSPGTGFPDPYPFSLSCYWVGTFQAIGGPATSQPGTTPRYLGARDWADGFEAPLLGDGGTGNGGNRVARDASRTIDGMGFAFRDNNNVLRTHSYSAPKPLVVWNRFYYRPRLQNTVGDDNIWHAYGSIDAGPAFILNVNTNGTLQGYNLANAVYPGTSLGTSAALTIGTWYRIDIRVELFTSATVSNVSAKMDVYINGTLSFTGGGTASTYNQSFNSCNVGEYSGATRHGLEADLDDWIGAREVSIVVDGVTTKYPGMDLTSGSHVQLVRPTGFGSGHATASWTGIGTAVAGAWQEANNNPANTSGITVGLTTTTTVARLELTTDYAAQQCGVACVAVGVFNASGSSPATCSFGIMTSLVTSPALQSKTLTTAAWTGIPNVYSVGSGATADSLQDIGDMSLVVVDNVAGGQLTIVGLFAQAEFIGIWGAEDAPPLSPSTFGTYAGIHNSPYPALHVNKTIYPPIGAIRVHSGVYVGNSIGQDILAKIAPHWWFVRPLSGSASGVAWYSSMMSAHAYLSEKLAPEAMPQAKLAVDGGRMSVGGSAAAYNGTPAYQYIAVSDPTMRYMMNGAFSHRTTVASAANALLDSGFTPDAVFLFIEDYVNTTTGHYYKGPGHTTNRASPLDAADSASIATFGAGLITSLTAINNDVPQTAYSAWRIADGSAGSPWVAITSYIGNASGADRDIALALNGKAPIWVMVIPHNAASFIKDASHLTTHSLQIGTGDSTTGIVGGGANKITINNSLNTNLIVYDVFAIAGGTTAFTNPTDPYTPVPEVGRVPGIWPAAPASVTISPVTLNVPAQWRIQRFDMKPRREEHA